VIHEAIPDNFSFNDALQQDQVVIYFSIPSVSDLEGTVVLAIENAMRDDEIL
jgi:hypothetical protein